jgi:hypothetical protein
MRIRKRTLSVSLLRIAVTVLVLGGILFAQNTSDKPSDQPADQSQETVYKSGTKGVTNPHLIHSVSPEYSDKARRAKLEGTAVGVEKVT